jgi:hypothetical protein
MFLELWLSTFFSYLGRKLRSTTRPAPSFRPRLELLEVRTVPSGVQGLHDVPSPAVPGSLHATAIIAPNDIWAVGSYVPAGSSTSQPLAEHFNGTSWSIVPTPKTPNSYFTSVSAVSSNDVWAVGNSGNGSAGLIEHYNGSSWSIVTNPVSGTGGWLNAVDAISANNVWAVGFTAGHGLIEHFNGSSWSVVPTSLPNNSDLFGVSGDSANDVWAVGLSLLSVSAQAPNNVWAVGISDHSNTLIEHFDGTRWSVVPSPNSTSIHLQAVSAVSASNVWAVGYTVDPNTGLEQTVTEHWDGTSWSVIPTPASSQDQALLGVATDSLGDVVAVGQIGTSTSQPQILHS